MDHCRGYHLVSRYQSLSQLIQKFFINWHHGSSRQFRIPERFWLVQSVLKGVIINSFTQQLRSLWFPVYIVIKPLTEFLNQVKSIRFFICYVF